MLTLPRRAPLLAALVTAALVRAWDIDLMALWTDEGLSFYRAGLDLPGILSGIIPVGQHPTRDVQPPLYFLLLGGWLRLLGFTAWNAKWLSLLAGLPTIALTWAIARRWAGRRAAAWAAWLAALSPAYLWYAQEVRPYALAITLAALAVYALDRGLMAAARERGSRDTVGWLVLATVANAALLYAHYLGFFVAGFEVVMAAAVLAGPAVAARWRARTAARGAREAATGSALVDRASRDARASISALAAAVALVALVATPLIPFAVRRLGTGAEKDQHFYGLHVLLRDMARGFSLGTALDFERYAVLAAVLTLGFLLLALGGAWHLWRARRGGFWRAAGWLLLPTVAFFLLTLIQPRYQGVRHLLLQSPPFYVLVAAGIAGLPGALAALTGRGAPGARRDGDVDGPGQAASRGPAVATAALGLFALGAMAWADALYYADDAGRKGDLRAMARYVADHALPGDVLALSDPVLVYAVGQHLRELPGADPALIDLPATLPNGLVDDRRPADQLVPLLRRYDRVWTMRPPEALAGWLAQHARKVDARSFPAGFGIPVRVDAWERLPTAGTLPTPMEPLALGPLQLLGWSVAGDEPPASPAGVWGAAPIPAGSLARVQLVWQAATRERPALKVALQLLDADGRNVADGDHEPFHGQHPTSAWAFGELTQEPHDLRVPPTVPPGRYRLAVRAYRPDTGEAFPADAPTVIGEVEVARAAGPVAASWLPLDGRLDAAARGATLVGWQLARPEGGAYDAGAALPLTLWLRLTDPDRAPASVRVEVIDSGGRTLREATLAVPVAGAEPGDLRAVAIAPPLPATAGWHGVRARLLDAAGRPLWLRRGNLPVRAAWLTTVLTDEPERVTAVPDMTHPLDAAVGEGLDLPGASLEGEIARGAPLVVTLYWRVDATPRQALNVTVQLIPIDVEDRPIGAPAAQHDGPPAEGARPTSGWRPGEVIADRHALAVPVDLAPGRYALIAALYDPAVPDAPRLRVEQPGYPDARDFAVIAVVAIGP